MNGEAARNEALELHNYIHWCLMHVARRKEGRSLISFKLQSIQSLPSVGTDDMDSK